MSIKKDAQTAHANLLEKTDPEPQKELITLPLTKFKQMLICQIELRCSLLWPTFWGCKALMSTR